MGSAAAGFKENKHKYQSNEYNKELGLNWMNFQNRQYDQHLCRFLSIDPLAAATPTMSPYTGMNNDPVSVTDPLGLQGAINMDAPMVNVSPAPIWPFLTPPPSSGGSNLSDFFIQTNGKQNEQYMQMKMQEQRASAWAEMMGKVMACAQGTVVTFNNGQPAIDADGAVIIYSTRTYKGTEKKNEPGFFAKIWMGFTLRAKMALSGLKNLLKAGDDAVTGHSVEEVVKQEQPGGTEFTDRNVGVAHSGHTGKNADGKSVTNASSSSLVLLANGWSTAPSAMWSVFADRSYLFTNVADLLHTDYHNRTDHNDTSAWFLSSDGRGVESRFLPKDSLKYFHTETYKDSQGYYGYGLQGND